MSSEEESKQNCTKLPQEQTHQNQQPPLVEAKPSFWENFGFGGTPSPQKPSQSPSQNDTTPTIPNGKIDKIPLEPDQNKSNKEKENKPFNFLDLLNFWQTNTEEEQKKNDKRLDNLELKQNHEPKQIANNGKTELNLNGANSVQEQGKMVGFNVVLTDRESELICELPGEVTLAIIQGEYENSFQYIPGLICLTNYKLRFISKEKDLACASLSREFLSISVDSMLIQRCDKYLEYSGQQYCHIKVNCKDTRSLSFRFSSKIADSAQHLLTLLLDQVFFKNTQRFPAFNLAKHSQLETEHQGWNVYDIKREFKRMAIPIHDKTVLQTKSKLELTQKVELKYISNEAKEICQTYPPFLVIPLAISDEELKGCARFRSLNRIPAFTFGCYQNSLESQKSGNLTSIWRSSQCKNGFISRSADDERMLSVLAELSPSKKLHIYDARPFMNAIGNKLAGKGYENTSSYQNSEIVFLEIHNIHKVRESFLKLVSVCATPDSEQQSWLKDVESSSWIEHISTIISGTKRICSSMQSGSNVLIHCSDGWDRTSQLSSLTQICFDPYYRTIEGFAVLIEKDWVNFGHQFNKRQGHACPGPEEENSPIFLQFLDCVHQLLLQFPTAFEFCDEYLYDISIASYNCLYGTFLKNYVQDKWGESDNIKAQTISVWSCLLSQKTKYRNPFFETEFQGFLSPDSHPRSLRLWSNFFLRSNSQTSSKKGNDKVQAGTDIMIQKHRVMSQKLEMLEKVFASISSLKTPENSIEVEATIQALSKILGKKKEGMTRSEELDDFELLSRSQIKGLIQVQGDSDPLN